MRTAAMVGERLVVQPDLPGSVALVVLSVVVAVALPVVASRQMTPALLREHYLLSKPGSILVLAWLLLGALTVLTLAAALAATVYPVFWATTALSVSMVAVVLLYLVRYRAAVRAYERDALDQHDGDREPPGA
ncbi:hypothetical protein ABIB37_002458 [Agrococcus sp. UYP10]|uniref:hypothetical protein n=1 Tax=Agrococcus sp. UYP10 TaxID=1756355 RepID=UPI003397839D